MEQVTVRVEGISPLLMHNGRLANPLDPTTQKLKELTGKRKKTEEDHYAITLAEWGGGIYYDPQIGPYLPGENIDACLVDAGKVNKKGSAFRRGLQCLTDRCPIEYEGPRDLETLQRIETFRDLRTVRNQQNRVLRCRPRFNQWATEFVLLWHPNIVDRADVETALKVAGLVGLGDYRERYGKFQVVLLDGKPFDG